ncbi:MAG: carboxypeptidase regulatory-like domain-containing protein [Thermoanaerobaculia bacterium]
MRSIALGLTLCAICVAVSGAARAQAPAAPVPPLDFRDDRGEPLASPLEVCFRTDLRADCVNVAAGEPFIPPAPLRSLRLEGPDHGPASFQEEDLRPGADGRLLVRVPRKALLQIDKPPAEPLDAAVYDVKAASFAKPLAKARVGPAGIKVPAGELLVALSSGRKAPDLHRLTVRPGGTARLEYRPREGWSLVVRSLDAQRRQAVAAAVVSLTAVPGYGAPSRPAGEGKTGADGLALFPGLAEGRVDAGVRHPDFLAQTAEGLSAAPGNLAFRDIPLEEGGWVRARVQVKGRSRQGVLCKLKDITAPASIPAGWAPKVIYEGRTDRDGVCRTGRFPAGSSYFLEVALAEGGATLKRPVVLENGRETVEDLAFSEIRVHGTVTRGGDPAPGFTVLAGEVLEDQGISMKLAEAASGKDGAYEFTLPKAGRFKFLLRPSPQSPPILMRDVVVEEGDESPVDFALEKSAVRGKVVDQDGKPVEGAVVMLYWRAAAHESFQRTDERGELEFLLESPGEGGVEAEKDGYRKSERLEITMKDGAEPPPFVLTLVKERAFRGTLFSAAGPPVAGGWMASALSPFLDEHIGLNESRTDPLGRFVLPPRTGRRNRIFASGPGCPLSFFDPIDTDGELSLHCQGAAAVLEFTLTNPEGLPVPGVQLILRHGNAIIPARVLARHLALQGLRAETDAYGHLVIPNLAPGDYEAFIAGPVTEGMLESGSRTGYLARTVLDPGSTVHYHLVVAGAAVVPAGGGE